MIHHVLDFYVMMWKKKVFPSKTYSYCKHSEMSDYEYSKERHSNNKTRTVVLKLRDAAWRQTNTFQSWTFKVKSFSAMGATLIGKDFNIFFPLHRHKVVEREWPMQRTFVEPLVYNQ